ncbi:hypothetical protein D3C87_1220130 [compost metagenome]
MSLAVLGMAVFGASAEEPKSLTARPDLVIGAFIDAQMRSDANIFNEILEEDAMLNVSRGKGVMKHSKKQLISFYKKTGIVVMNCTADYKIISQNENIILSRVDFKFDHFTQQNYITIEKDKNNAWKVVNINRFNV